MMYVAEMHKYMYSATTFYEISWYLLHTYVKSTFITEALCLISYCTTILDDSYSEVITITNKSINFESIQTISNNILFMWPLYRVIT